MNAYLLVVVVLRLREEELLAVSGVLEALLGGDHGEVLAALLGRHHRTHLLLRRQPEARLDHPPVRVVPSPVELGARLQPLPVGEF